MRQLLQRLFYIVILTLDTQLWLINFVNDVTH